jgi:hypothetical protein
MSDFCLVVTSRGRPDNWKRLFGALQATVTGEIDLQLVLDLDDPTAPEYVDWMLGNDYTPQLSVTVFRGQRVGHVQSLNLACTKAAEQYRVVGQMGDDHLPRTVGWDQRISEALATPGIAYGDDLLQGENLPTAVFFHGDVIRATGKFAPEGLWHLYADNYWRDLGLAAGCLRYLPDVVIEHLHPVAGKAASDVTYEESNSSAVDRADCALWDDYVASGRLEADAAKVRAIL